MNSNSISGAAVLVKKINPKDIEEYENKLKGMDIKEFVKFTGADNLQKSYEAYKVNLRKKYISMYYVEWGKSTYIDALTDSVHGNKMIEEDDAEWVLKQISKINMTTVKGSYARIESLQYMVHEIQPWKDRYTCTVFSLNKSGITTWTNYAYLYSLIRDNDIGELEIKHSYFCTGPNLISADGEYRSRFTNMVTLEHVQLYFADLWNEVEEYLLHRPNVKFNQDYYIASQLDVKHNKFIKEDINNNRFVIKFYIIAWLSQGLISYLGLQNKHVDSTYNKNMFDPEDNRFIHELIQNHTLNKIRLFHWVSGYINNPIAYKSLEPKERFNPKCGQKIVPLTEDAFNNVMNLEHTVWMEYYISLQVSKLFINLICPGAPITHDWFILYGVNKWLFNNPEMYKKVEISDEAKHVVHKLKKARKTAYYGMDLKSEVLSRMSKEFDYKEEELFISDKGILIISEHVGRTVNDIAYILKSEEYKKSIGSMFSSYNRFAKYMFDVTYSLLCMNARLNVIHGDLHLNNVTIQHVYKSYIHDDPGKAKKGLKSVYTIDDKVFVFNDTGQIGTIIDFSRGFIIPKDGYYKGNLDKIQQKQIDRILSYYNNLFPEFIKEHGVLLKTKLHQNFLLVYKIFSAIDMYIHTDRLEKFIKIHPILNAHKKSIALVNKISSISRFYLETVMSRVIKKDTGASNIKYPNHDIILRCFGEFILTPEMSETDVQIHDVFFFNNSLRYSLQDFDRLPPRIKYVKLKKKDSPETIPIPYSIQAKERLKTFYIRRESEIKKMAEGIM